MTLRNLRRRRGWSQERLSLEGVARSYVSELERGRSDPKLTMLWHLAELLEEPMSSLARDIEHNYARLKRERKNHSKS